MGDPNLRDMIYWIYNKFKNVGTSSGGGSGITQTQLDTALDGKVDKVVGKGLSTNDYTTADKNKISLIGNKLDKGGYIGTAQDLKNSIDAVDSKTVYWNDVQNKPELNYLPLTGGNINGAILFEDKIKVLSRPDGSSIAFGNKNFNDLVYGEFKGIKVWGNNDNNKVVLAGGGVKNLSDFLLQSWNLRKNKEVIRTQVDEWLRINEFNSHANGVYFGTSVIRTDGQVQVGEGGAEAILSNLGLILKKRLRINAWAGGDGADIKCKGNMQIGSSSGIIYFRKISDDLVNWNGNTTVTIDINNGILIVNGIKTPSADTDNVFFTNGNSGHLATYIGTSGYVTGNWAFNQNWYGRCINMGTAGNIDLRNFSQNQNFTVRKCFTGGEITFNTTGKTVVYTSGNRFNGGDGSTAHISTANGNKMYIDIKNI